MSGGHRTDGVESDDGVEVSMSPCALERDERSVEGSGLAIVYRADDVGCGQKITGLLEVHSSPVGSSRRRGCAR